MSKITTLIFTANDGQTFNFSVYRKETQFKPIPALYAFMKRGEDGRYRVLYIGKTKDLSTRFDNHHKWDEASRLGFEYIAVCTDITLAMLDVAEKGLIAHYRPRCNEQLVP